MLQEPELTALLQEITRRIREVSDPEQIILFGSYARGDAGPDSDMDVLVIENGVVSPRQASTRLRRNLRGLPVGIDVIVATPEIIRRYAHSIGMICRPALDERKVLYEREPTFA